MKFFLLCCALIVFAVHTEHVQTGGFLDKTNSLPRGKSLDFIRTLRRRNCPCTCMRPDNARRQCRRFSSFCDVSQCTRGTGQRGERCCQRAVGGFGRCQCLANRFTIAVSFRSELRARALLADLCAIRKSCPPNCNCGSCPTFNVLCITFRAPGGQRGWACSADCRGTVTTCRRIPGTR